MCVINALGGGGGGGGGGQFQLLSCVSEEVLLFT